MKPEPLKNKKLSMLWEHNEGTATVDAFIDNEVKSAVEWLKNQIHKRYICCYDDEFTKHEKSALIGLIDDAFEDVK